MEKTHCSYSPWRAAKRIFPFIVAFYLAVVAVTLFLFSDIVFAADTHEVNLVAEWAWSGSDTTAQGFRLYKDGIPIHDVVGSDKRTEELTYQLENGEHIFSITAYGEKDGVAWETAHSPEYRVEYLYVPTDDGRPAPTTIYIRIN